MTEFHDRLRQLRREKGITQEEFARCIGVTPEAVAQYETGKRFPKLHIFIRIADFYQVSTDWLLRGQEIKPSKRKEKTT